MEKYIFVLREMLAKKGVSILIEMTGEWEFHYLFFFFPMICFLMKCCFVVVFCLLSFF